MLANEITITAVIAAASVLTVAALAWREKRVRTSLDPSLLPSTPIMLFAGVVAILSIVHMLNLFGIQTGR